MLKYEIYDIGDEKMVSLNQNSNSCYLKRIKQLYSLYGFVKEEEAEGYILFSNNYGFFYNLECIKLIASAKTDEEVEKKKNEYRDLGYQNIREHYFETLEKEEIILFQAYFQPERQKKILKNEYKKFKKYQEKHLQIPYEYITSDFQRENQEIETNIIEYILKNKKECQAQLTILEAAAGYGKTCTVYEILSKLLEQKKLQVPILVELSKNRNARLFRYVLQDEIDKKFTMLSSKVVINEIKSGRLPLIIDGFDELIEQKNKILDDADERSLSMLSTIADLLGEDSKAWVLLTTRNSAIFSGELFEEWIVQKLGVNCIVERLRIVKPSVKTWLGEDLYEILGQQNINLEDIANPVLLTFLKGMNKDKIAETFRNQESILEKYIELLFKRDNDRQELCLSKKEHYEILKKIAGNFALYDITAESSEFIQELIEEILENNILNLLERYRENNLISRQILTKQEYIQRLAHSCLLDRVSFSQNNYGFINEYILGILAGDAVLDGINANELTERYLDIINTAYRGRSDEKRRELYKKIEDRLSQVDDACRLYADCSLLKSVKHYSKAYFKSFEFDENICFTEETMFDECTFESCCFSKSTLKRRMFRKCYFFNCQFYEIVLDKPGFDDSIFVHCVGEEKLVLPYQQERVKQPVLGVDPYEKIVLEQFWKSGYAQAELRRTYTAFFKGINAKDYGNIQEALQKLLKRGILKELNICYELNTKHMTEIKTILGR